MKHIELVRWLRVVLIVAMFLGPVFGGFIIPALGREAVAQNPELAFLFWPCLIFFWITFVPYYLVLGVCWGIASEIAADRSFSEKNAHALKIISRLFLTECGLYFAGITLLFIVDVMHISLLLFAMLVIFCGATLALVSVLASRLVLKAWEMKQDQDLTI
jgi:MFS family permease